MLHHLAGHLVRRQQEGGGWSYTDLSHQTDVDNTSVVVPFLHTLDPDRYGEPIRRGISSLLTFQGPDGGFPTYVAGARPRLP
ncbi:hypothetical protein ACFPM3_05545 [Streptomyces coeruleoprunus]|uniref:Squalene cyclase C-terminal domain-containing protein n=1 Tax=Streptomyces coeruleoprunus TaxID=285563 RepID=A0ABV9X827_9ACTN